VEPRDRIDVHRFVSGIPGQQYTSDESEANRGARRAARSVPKEEELIDDGVLM